LRTNLSFILSNFSLEEELNGKDKFSQITLLIPLENKELIFYNNLYKDDADDESSRLILSSLNTSENTNG